MSFDSSDLLSEGSQSHTHDERPFSFHGYLDEVAGMNDSDIDTDTEAEEDKNDAEKDEEEDRVVVATGPKNNKSANSPIDDALMLQNESGISYDESVQQQDTTDQNSESNPMTRKNEIETQGKKSTNCETPSDLLEAISDHAKSDDIAVLEQYTDMDTNLEEADSQGNHVVLDAKGVASSAGNIMADISSSLIMDEPALTHMERPAERTMVHSPPHIKNVAALDDDDALSPGIVQSPQKNVSPLPMKKVRMSPLVKTATFNKRPLETPPRMGKSLDNQFDSQKSKRPKMISPFSPTARKLRLKQQSSSSSGGTAMTQQLQQLSSQLKWSMAPSRKVSILVNVSPRLDAPLSSNDEESRLCLYPNVAVEDSGNVHQSSLGYSPARSVRSSYSVTSHASILRKASPGQEVILVNPNAFGDVIPTAVTVETARVVQQFSNKVSEDWVRKYRFDEVCWPDVKQLIGIKKQNTNATMEDISKATVADVVDCKSSVLFGYGIRHSGRLESMFGYIAGEKMDSLRVSVGRKSVGLELGLLGLIVSKLLEKNTSDQGKSVLVQLSMVEILDEDVLKDLLESPSNKASNIVNKSVRIRHPDNKGAILENVTELNIKSLSDVKNAIKKAFHSKYNMKERQMVGGRGHVIATLRVFLNDDDNTANKERKGYNHPMIQLIDLACAETDCMDREAVTGRTKLEINRILNRRVAGIRKSMAGLGAILRRLVVNEVRDLPQSSMYRSSTLTKLIQRALDHVSSRALMISTVCPRRDSYRRTLHTLNYMHRLLVKPSKTAESPFEGKSYELDGHSVGTFNFFSPGDHSIANSAAYSVASSVASEAIRSEFAHAKGSREFMKSLVTDPRQRLATLLSPKDSPIDVASPGIPMAEITTINEVENDNVDDSTNEHVKDDDTTSLHAHDSDPLDASLPEKHNVDVSPDKLSALSDEITFGDSREEALDASFQDDMAHAGHNDATFDKVLEQLDEIDTYNENEDSDCLISGIESFTENTDSPPKSNESVEGHTSGGLDDELKESHPSISKQSDDFSSNDSYKPQEELIADNSKSATQTKASKPDPTGILYDELSKSSRKKSDASSNLHKRHNMVTGISSRDLALAVDDHYASDQSPVSTLTPYDVTTREDEAGTYREKASSMSTEESFPLNPRNRGVAGTSSFQESNYGSDDVQTQTSEPEQGHNSVDQRYHGPDCIPEERTKGKDNVTSYGNLRDSKPKDSLKALIARSQGGDVSSETSNRKSSDQGSDPETSSRREFDDDLDSTRYKTPSGLNSSLNIAKDIESVTLSNDGDCVRGDGNVPSRNTTNDSGDIVAEASENCTSGLPLAGKNDAGDAEKNLSIISNKSEMPRTSIHGSGDDQKRIVVELRKPNAIAVGNESPVASSKELLSDYDQKIKKEASADVAENNRTRLGASLEIESDCREAKRSISNDGHTGTDQGHDVTQYKSLSKDDDVGDSSLDRDESASSLAANYRIEDANFEQKNDEMLSSTRFATIVGGKRHKVVVDNFKVEEDNDNVSKHDFAYRETESNEERMFKKGSYHLKMKRNECSDSVAYINQGEGYDQSESLSVNVVGSGTNHLSPSHGRGMGISRMHIEGAEELIDNAVTGSDRNIIEHESLSVASIAEGPASKCIASEGSFEEQPEKVVGIDLDHLEEIGRSNNDDSIPSMAHEDEECESLSSIDDEDMEIQQMITHHEIVEDESNNEHGIVEVRNEIKHQKNSYSEHVEDRRKTSLQDTDRVSSAYLKIEDGTHSQRVTAMYTAEQESMSLSIQGIPNCSNNRYPSEMTDKLLGSSSSLKSKDSENGKAQKPESDNLSPLNESSKDRVLEEQGNYGQEGASLYSHNMPSRASVSQSKSVQEGVSVYSRHDVSQSTEFGKDVYPYDQSSSDGESLQIEPSSSSIDFTNDVAIPRHNWVGVNSSNSHDISLIQSELDRLEMSLKRCVESTHESELLKELASDKRSITSTFNPDEKPVIRTIKELASQADALQSFIKTKFQGFHSSRELEQDSDYDLLETSSNVDEALTEIHSLKSSTLASLDQIKKDHIDALNENTQRLKAEKGKQKLSAQEKSVKDTNEGMSQNIEHDHIETRLCDEKEITIQDETNPESNNVLPSYIATLLSKDKDALSEVLQEFSDFRSGLEDGREYNVSDLLKQTYALENKLFSHSKITDDLLVKMKRIRSKSTEANAAQTDDSVENRHVLHGYFCVDEKEKDELEDRLTDEINKLQSLLDEKCRTIDDLNLTVSKYKGAINCSTDNEKKLREEISLLQNLVKTVSSSAEDAQSISSKQLSKLKEEIGERSKTVNVLRQNLETMKNDYDNRLIHERHKCSSLENEIAFLRNCLGEERRENDSDKEKLQDKISRLEKEFTALESNVDACKKSHDITLSEYDEKLENEVSEKRRLLDELNSMQHDLHRIVQEKNCEGDHFKKQLDELQNELYENNTKYIELTEKLKLENVANEGKVVSQEKLITKLEQKINELENRLSQKSARYAEVESEFEKKLQDLNKDLLIKNETNHALEEKIAYLKKDYENRMKFDAVEKAAMEEDISTLQQRLREETQERDDAEYRLSTRLETLSGELSDLKRKNNELRYSLNEIRNEHESVINQLQSEKKSKAAIEEENIELEGRLSEELKCREEIANKLVTCNEELRKKIKTIERLSLELDSAQEETKNANQRITSELEEKNIMANELTTIQRCLADEVEKHAAFKEQNSRFVKEMQADIDKEKQRNSNLCNEIATLKMDHESLQGKLSASMTEHMKDKASFHAQVSSLENVLEKVSETNEDLKKSVLHITHENESLKERVEAECQKLTTELTERMKEKAYYDSEIGKLSIIVEQSTQESIRVQEELSACKATLSDTEDRLASSADERCRQEEILRNRIAHLETALEDCCKSRKELEISVQALQSEKEEFSRVTDELNLFKKSSEEQKEIILKERDDLIAKVNVTSTKLQETEARLLDLTSDHTELDRNYSETLKSLDDLKMEHEVATKQYAAKAVEWETKFNELSVKLSNEADGREAEKDMYIKEISKISSEASAERENYLDALKSADGKYSLMKEEFEVEMEKCMNVQEEMSVKISSLEDMLEEKEKLSNQLQEQLDAVQKEVSSLNEIINNSSNEHSKTVRTHTENIHVLESIIKEKEMQLVVENENTENLRDEIKVLNDRLKEETEKCVKLEQMHMEEVGKLNIMITENTEEFERFEQRLSNQTHEIEDLAGKLAQEISYKKQLQKEAEEVRNIRSTLKELEEKLSAAMKEKDCETEKKEQAIWEANNAKVQMEQEIEILRQKYDAEIEKMKNVSQQLHQMQSSIQGKDDSIQELETTVFKLKESLEKECTKIGILEKTRESKDRENANLLQQIKALEDRMSEEYLSSSSEMEKLKHSLESKVAKNSTLEELVNKLQQEKEEIKRAMELKLEESKEMNLGLSESLQKTKNDLQRQIQELENEKNSNHDASDKKLQELSERISELSVIKDALQDENALLKEKIVEEKTSREQIDRKNNALKTALAENERQVREEMRELESTMKMTISRIETKRKKAVEEERNRLSSIVDRLESENDGYKIKIAQLESTIHHLESRMPAGGSLGTALGDNSTREDLKRENDELRSHLLLLQEQQQQQQQRQQQQQQQQQHSPPKPRFSSHHPQEHNYSDDTFPSNYYSMEYHLEKQRRIKAEEFAAAMAARAKAGFEQRNQEIMALRVKVSTLESEKENFQKQQILLLEGDTIQNQSDLSRPAALTLAIQQRDEALDEARKYRSIAKKLNSQVQYFNQWVNNSGEDERDREKVTLGAENNVIIGVDDSSTLSSKKGGTDLDLSHGFGV